MSAIKISSKVDPEVWDDLKELAEETVDLFRTDRRMVALNWWKDGPTSDADGLIVILDLILSSLSSTCQEADGLSNVPQRTSSLPDRSCNDSDKDASEIVTDDIHNVDACVVHIKSHM